MTIDAMTNTLSPDGPGKSGL